eukprot:s4028_g1.t1
MQVELRSQDFASSSYFKQLGQAPVPQFAAPAPPTRQGLDTPENVASFLAWLLNEVPLEEFGGREWNIGDPETQQRWLRRRSIESILREEWWRQQSSLKREVQEKWDLDEETFAATGNEIIHLATRPDGMVRRTFGLGLSKILHAAATLRRIMSISVDVHLLSGKSASLEVEPDASIESLKQRAQRALAKDRGRLLNSSGEVLDAATTIVEAGLQSGDVLTLQVNQAQLKATKRGGKFSAFAMLLGDGSVVSWGNADCGGDSAAVQDQLRDVCQVQASGGAFAAIRGDGSVITWGSSDFGGDSSAVQDQLRDVQQIQASMCAFAAILGRGSVVAWGRAYHGGDSRAVQDQLRDVQQIQASMFAFAAILGDGSVVTWGGANCGGYSRAVQVQLRDVRQIQAAQEAFVAILDDGSVVSWGNARDGGDSGAMQEQLRDVQQIQASSHGGMPAMEATAVASRSS